MKFVLKAIDKLSPALGAINKRFAKVGAAGAGFKKVLGNITRAGISMARNILGGLANLSKKFLLLGTIAATAFGIIIRSSISTTDRLNKTAGKIGTTTEELSRLRYAAELTGVAQNNLDMALQRFTRRAAEAAAGTGEAKNALKALGVDAQKLVKMPLSERMLVLADAFGKVTDKPQKLALAFKLFDSEGAQLVTTLDAGREAIEEMMLEADLLGVTMEQSLADKTSKAEDAITRLKAIFGGVTRQVAAQLSPAITTFVTIIKDKLLERIKESNGSVQEFAKTLGIKLLQAIKAGVVGFEKLVNAAGAAMSGINAFINGIRTAPLRAQVALAQNEVDFLKETISKKKTGDLDYMDRLALKVRKIPNDLIALQGAFIDARGELADKQLDLAIMVGDAEPPNWAERFNLDGMKTTLDEMMTKMEETTVGINEGFTQPIINSASLIGQEFTERLTAATSVVTTTTLTAFSAIATGAQQIVQTLMNVTEKGSKEHKALFLISKGIAVAQAIINAQTAGAATLAGYAAALPMVAVGGPAAVAAWQAKGMAMASLVTSMGYANAALIAATAVKSYDGGGFTGTGSRSGGVDGKGGFPAILHPNETVIDHTKGQTIGGEPTVVVNQTLNISTGVESTVRAEIANLMPQIAEATSSAVAQQRMRGGNYSRQLLGR